MLPHSALVLGFQRAGRLLWEPFLLQRMCLFSRPPRVLLESLWELIRCINFGVQCRVQLHRKSTTSAQGWQVWHRFCRCSQSFHGGSEKSQADDVSPVNSWKLTPFNSISWIAQQKRWTTYLVYFLCRDAYSWQHGYLFMLSLAHRVSRLAWHYHQQDHLWSTITTAPMINLEDKYRFIQ